MISLTQQIFLDRLLRVLGAMPGAGNTAVNKQKPLPSWDFEPTGQERGGGVVSRRGHVSGRHPGVLPSEQNAREVHCPGAGRRVDFGPGGRGGCTWDKRVAGHVAWGRCVRGGGGLAQSLPRT